MAYFSDPRRRLAERQGSAVSSGPSLEVGLAVIERGGLVSRDEVADVVHDVIKLFVPFEELAVASPQGVHQARHRLEAVELGVVEKDDPAAISRFPFTAPEHPEEGSNHVVGGIDLQVARVDAPKHARVASRGEQLSHPGRKRPSRGSNQPGPQADRVFDLRLADRELGVDLGVVQERKLAVGFGVIPDHVSAADDLSNDLAVLTLPGIAAPKALGLDEEHRAEVELVQEVEKRRRGAARGAVVEAKEDRATLGGAVYRQAAWITFAGHVVRWGARLKPMRDFERERWVDWRRVFERAGHVGRHLDRLDHRRGPRPRSAREGATSNQHQDEAAQPHPPWNHRHDEAIVRKRDRRMRESRSTCTCLQLLPPILSTTPGAPTSTPVIEVETLSKRYGTHLAVNEVSFDVKQGEIVGFLGPNGAGKTTTLRMLTGYLAPTAGKIRIDGIDAVRSSIRARTRLGYMPEGVPLYREMRVHEYLRHRAALKHVSEVRAAVDRVLMLAGVTDVKNRIVGQLSKGYRQRVGLADALVADPPLLILDEPTSGLDPNQVRQFRDLVRGFGGSKTVFLSTHILSEVQAVCDRVIIIREGRKVADLTLGQTTKLEDMFAELTTNSVAEPNP